MFIPVPNDNRLNMHNFILLSWKAFTTLHLFVHASDRNGDVNDE